MKYTWGQLVINKLGRELWAKDIWYDQSIENNKKTADLLLKDWMENKEGLEDFAETIRIDLDIAPGEQARKFIQKFVKRFRGGQIKKEIQKDLILIK